MQLFPFMTSTCIFLFAENVVVRRYLNCMNNDVDKTKKLIEHSYNMRFKYPNIFNDRDPIDDKIRNIYTVVWVLFVHD